MEGQGLSKHQKTEVHLVEAVEFRAELAHLLLVLPDELQPLRAGALEGPAFLKKSRIAKITLNNITIWTN